MNAEDIGKGFDAKIHRLATADELAAILKARGYTDAAYAIEKGIAEAERVKAERVKLSNACKAMLPASPIKDMGDAELAAVLKWKDRQDAIKSLDRSIAQSREALEDVRTLEADAMKEHPPGEWWENGGRYYTNK